MSVVSSVGGMMCISPTKFSLTKLNFIYELRQVNLDYKTESQDAKEKENDSDVFTLLFTKVMCSLLRVFIYIFLQLIANLQLARVAVTSTKNKIKRKKLRYIY